MFHQQKACLQPFSRLYQLATFPYVLDLSSFPALSSTEPLSSCKPKPPSRYYFLTIDSLAAQDTRRPCNPPCSYRGHHTSEPKPPPCGIRPRQPNWEPPLNHVLPARKRTPPSLVVIPGVTRPRLSNPRLEGNTTRCYKAILNAPRYVSDSEWKRLFDPL